MRTLRLTIMAFILAVAGSLSVASVSQADFAANQSRIPGALAGSGVQSVAYNTGTKWYNGCNRYYYCKYRKWVCGAYGYNCHWEYSGCYYGSCLGGGGYRRGGGGY